MENGDSDITANKYSNLISPTCDLFVFAFLGVGCQDVTVAKANEKTQHILLCDLCQLQNKLFKVILITLLFLYQWVSAATAS